MCGPDQHVLKVAWQTLGNDPGMHQRDWRMLDISIVCDPGPTAPHRPKYVLLACAKREPDFGDFLEAKRGEGFIVAHV
jgi:hypothetical protein